MRFGLALDFGTHVRDLASHAEGHLELVRLAERSGAYDSVWVGDGYLNPPEHLHDHVPSPLVMLAFLARATKLKVGTGVLLAPAWHPIRLAHDVAVLDHLSRGRLILGLGLGSPALQRRFGLDPASYPEVFEETIGYLKASWRGRDFKGRILGELTQVVPMPSQTSGPPLWVAGSVTRSAERAATLGDGYYAATAYGLELIRRLAARYREALPADMTPGVVAANRVVIVGRTSNEAHALARKTVGSLLDAYLRRGVIDGYQKRRVLEDLDGVDTTRISGAGLFDLVGDQFCIVGSAEKVADLIGVYDQAGVTQINARVSLGGMPLAGAKRTVQALAEISSL